MLGAHSLAGKRRSTRRYWDFIVIRLYRRHRNLIRTNSTSSLTKDIISCELSRKLQEPDAVQCASLISSIQSVLKPGYITRLTSLGPSFAVKYTVLDRGFKSKEPRSSLFCWKHLPQITILYMNTTASHLSRSVGLVFEEHAHHRSLANNVGI